MSGKKKLEQIGIEYNCKTLLLYIYDVYSRYKPSISINEHDNGSRLLIVFNFNELNSIRLDIFKFNSKEDKFRLVLKLHKTTEKGNLVETFEEEKGTASHLLDYLRINNDNIEAIIKSNCDYYDSVYELLDIVHKRHMNKMLPVSGRIEHTFICGSCLVYRVNYITDTIFISQVYLLQNLGSTVKVVHSLVKTEKNERTKLNENTLYVGPVRDLRTILSQLTFLDKESKEEKQLIKEYHKAGVY